MAAISQQKSKTSFFNSKRGRRIAENLTAYAFLAPAGLLIFIFELFPVAFAFFVSLHRWRRFPDDYEGLDTFVEATGNFAFVLFFWLAIGIVIFGCYALWRYIRTTLDNDERHALIYLIPGIAQAVALFGFVNWFFSVLPEILLVPRRLRGTAGDTQAFVTEFFASFRFEHVLVAHDLMWLTVLVAAVSTVILYFVKSKNTSQYMLRTVIIGSAFLSAFFVMQLTVNEMQLAIAEAIEDGESAPIWTQVIVIGAGAGLIGAALYFWQTVVKSATNRQFFLRSLALIGLIIGGALLVMFIPRAMANADDDVLQSFAVTFMYSFFTVPIQLSLGLALAVMLYQNIRGRTIFRIIYFLPYITPAIATSVIFRLLFSLDSSSPVNRFLGIFGIEPQNWLLEPRGIFKLMFGDAVPDALAGPGLALVVIIIYGIWTFAGYSTVIFLAGLGNIDSEVYEAARMDGANGWQQFRFVTLPLLSPTTFFLILITTIGTLQAFTQIFLLRQPVAYDAVDTVNILIYNEVRTTSPDYAYGSAMAFVLFGVILILTLIQNRIVGRRVFYG